MVHFWDRSAIRSIERKEWQKEQPSQTAGKHDYGGQKDSEDYQILNTAFVAVLLEYNERFRCRAIRPIA